MGRTCTIRGRLEMQRTTWLKSLMRKDYMESRDRWKYRIKINIAEMEYEDWVDWTDKMAGICKHGVSRHSSSIKAETAWPAQKLPTFHARTCTIPSICLSMYVYVYGLFNALNFKIS